MVFRDGQLDVLETQVTDSIRLWLVLATSKGDPECTSNTKRFPRYVDLPGFCRWGKVESRGIHQSGRDFHLHGSRTCARAYPRVIHTPGRS